MNPDHTGILFVILLAAAVPAASFAQSTDEARAKAAFAEGTELFSSNQFKAAAAAFREAYDLKPSWKILYNIGQCHAAAKEYGLALEAFEAYLASGGDDIPLDKKTAVINELKTTRELVGYLNVTAEDGLTVFTDENSRGTTPLPGPVPVSAGVNHLVRFERDGEVVEERTIRVNSGNTMTVETAERSDETPIKDDANVKQSQDPVPPAPTPAEPKKGLLISGIVITGLGIAAFGGALGTGLKALSLNKSLDGADCSGNVCDNDLNTIDRMELLTNVFLGVGGGLTAAGVALLIAAAVKKKKAKHAVSVVPAVSTQTAGLTFGTTF